MSNEFTQGWPVLVAGTLGNAAGVGAIMYYSMSSFMVPLEAEFGWSRTDMGFAVSCLVFGWIITMPLLGMLCDRFGPRQPILWSIPPLALVLASLSLLQGELLWLYSAFLIGAVLGSGTLGITYISAVSGYFVANRGLAYGITLAGTGISAFALPIILHSVIEDFGWRSAWLVLAALAALQYPVAWLCIRDNRAPHSGIHAAEPRLSAPGLSVPEVLRSRTFWLLAAAFLSIALLLSGLMINMIPLLREAGLSKQGAATATAGIGIGLLVARVVVGFMLDRLPARFVAVFAFAVAAVGCQLLYLQNLELASLGTFALGFTAGSELDLLAYMTSRYFGMKNHATVYAIGLSIFYLGAVVAPVLIGELHAYGGGYGLALQAAMVSCLVASLLILAMGPYPELRRQAAS